jgi:hypothetical protein
MDDELVSLCDVALSSVNNRGLERRYGWNESTLITAAVLAATFIFSASRQIIKVLYILLFISAVLFETIHSQFAQSILNGYAVTLLVAVALLQAADRLWWHVALTRPFPDY